MSHATAAVMSDGTVKLYAGDKVLVAGKVGQMDTISRHELSRMCEEMARVQGFKLTGYWLNERREIR